MKLLNKLFSRRAVTEVDSWDGSASNYESTEQYCKACLIDVNAAAGREEKAQSHCLLPVKAPGSNDMADKAIFAAAGGRGITAVKKPSDVPQEDWDKAVKSAANTIISAYDELDRQAPEAVYELAEKMPPSQRSKEFSMDDVLAELVEILEQSSTEPADVEERAIMFDQVAQQVEAWTYAEHGRPWFMTFYLEQGQLFGLFNDRGQLMRAGLDLADDGQTLVIGEMEPVVHEFTPVERSSFSVIRQADGRVRFFMVAGTAIINRVGEIDSTALYDDMIRRAEETGYYPKLDFYHLGESNPVFEFGQFDFLGREGIVYVGSGLFDEDHPLALAAERALRKQPTTWGASIEYYRPQNRGVEYVDLGNGLEIAAYTEGLNTRISLLPEAEAAAWFTSITMERAMDEKKLQALRTLFDGNEEAFQKFFDKLGNVNQEVRDKGLVFREKDEKPVQDEPASEETQDEAPVEDTVVELDDAALDAIVRTAKIQFESEILGQVTETLNTMTANLAKLTEGQQAMLATVNGMQERINTLEQDEEQKQRTWLQDLPERTQGQMRVTYRPRDEHAGDPDPERISEAQAQKVLNGLPKVGFTQ